MKLFDPNSITFDQGAERVRAAVKRVKLDNGRIVTSRDQKARELQQLLSIQNVPQGFQQWQLPVVLERTQLFLTSAAPHTTSPEHAHEEGAGVRFIISGSIQFGSQELTAGDWMYVPAGVRYSFSVGEFGAVMGYCYACSCAGIQDL